MQGNQATIADGRRNLVPRDGGATKIHRPANHGRPRILRRASARLQPGVSRQLSHKARAPELSSLLLHLLPAMGLFLTLVFQLWVRVCIIESGYELEATRQQAVNKDAELRKLRLDFAMLTTPRTLVARAAKELGMGIPAADRIRKMEGRKK